MNKKKNYVVNLEGLADADSDEGLSAEPLNREWHRAGCVADCSERLEYSHSLSFLSFSRILAIA